MSEHNDSEKLSDIEMSLQSLIPQPAALDTEKLAWESGRASARGSWTWPALSALSTGLAILFAILWQTTTPRIQTKVVVIEKRIPVPEQPKVPEEHSGQEEDDLQTTMLDPPTNSPTYFQQRNLVLKLGPSALPAPILNQGMGEPLQLSDVYHRPDAEDPHAPVRTSFDPIWRLP